MIKIEGNVEKELEALICEVIRKKSENPDNHVAFDKVDVLANLQATFREIFGDNYESKIHGAFSSGGVTVTTDYVDIGEEEIRRLADALKPAETFSITPRVDKKFYISATAKIR